MNGQFLLVSGTASRACTVVVLARAMDFMQALVSEGPEGWWRVRAFARGRGKDERE